MAIEEDKVDKSYRINGFAESRATAEAFKNSSGNLRQSLSDLRIDYSRICPVLIESLGDYINYISNEFPNDSKRPVYYRVQSSANYYNVPSVLRDKKIIENEKWIVDEAQKRFPEGFTNCKNTLAKLQYIQHYNGITRLLDISESPLATLMFAVKRDGKFPSSSEKENYFATITTFQAPKESTDDYTKPFTSSTVSVLSCASLFDREFSYAHIDIAYLNDGFLTKMKDYVFFQDIIRRSVIVSVPQDNPRIRNQKGAFIIVNANELVEINNHNDLVESFMNHYLKDKLEKTPNNLAQIKEGCSKFLILKDCNQWSFKFRKVEPYSLDNKYKEFQDDPFNLNKLYYRNKEGKRVVFFIPPYAKRKILAQLEKIGFTYDYVYPEADTIFHDLGDIVSNL